MSYKIFIIGLVTAFILQSCDCWVIVDGNLIDFETGKPLVNAQLEFLNIKSINYSKSNDSLQVNNIFKTDSLGHFTMMSNNYGICPNTNTLIKIQKEGYLTKKYTIKENIDKITIKLTKK